MGLRLNAASSIGRNDEGTPVVQKPAAAGIGNTGQSDINKYKVYPILQLSLGHRF